MAETPESTHIAIENRGAVRIITFNRPEKKNALTVAMYDALTHALQAADEDPAVHVAVLTGAGDVFTSGNDLRDFVGTPPAGEDSPVFRFLTTINRFSKPLVAAVDGVAIGIGTTMLLHCDLVIASNRARFQMPFVNLAVTPEGASSLLLPQRVGLQRASEWLMLGEPFDAAAAHQAGMVNAVVAPEELMAATMARTEALAAKPQGALRAAKELIRGPMRAAVTEVYAREGAIFIERLMSEEAQQVFMAFLSRKK